MCAYRGPPIKRTPYIYIFLYIYICILYIYIYIWYLFIHSHWANLSRCAHKYVKNTLCVSVWMCMWRFMSHTDAHTHTHTHTCTHAHTHTRIHTYTHTHRETHTHTNTHTHAHTHAQCHGVRPMGGYKTPMKSVLNIDICLLVITQKKIRWRLTRWIMNNFLFTLWHIHAHAHRHTHIQKGGYKDRSIEREICMYIGRHTWSDQRALMNMI